MSTVLEKNRFQEEEVGKSLPIKELRHSDLLQKCMEGMQKEKRVTLQWRNLTNTPQPGNPEHRQGCIFLSQAIPLRASQNGEATPRASGHQPADSGAGGGEGGPPQVAGARTARPEDRLTLLLRLRAQTKQQLLEYKSVVDANEEKTPEQIMQDKQIEAKIEDLENEMEDVKIAFDIKTLALDRMQLSTALKKNLAKINPKTNALMDNMKHVLKLNKLIMKSHQESWDLEEKLLDARKKRLQLKQASESKLLEIQTEKNKQKDDLANTENSDKIKTIPQNLQMEIQITTVIQHVFQNLLLGSKANWAEESAFKETVLQLEKNLTMI
uniref:centromere protein H-like n=1 Tax=Halichoerus grypus TaxID=9711 RepID=UPI001658CF46|nr:centromere protein H-like [Halichoerus grypus]